MGKLRVPGFPATVLAIAGFVFAVACSGYAQQTAKVSSTPPEEKSVVVFGQKIHYVEAGNDGPTLILLHGLGADSSIWAANLATLSEKTHVFAIDQIGFGRSDKPLLDYRITTFTDFLYGFMQALKIPRATLVGHSVGGWVAADFAVQHHDMIDKLVLVDSAGVTPKEWKGGRTPVNLNPASLTDTRKTLEFLFYDKAIITDQLVQQLFERRLRNGDGYTVTRVLEGMGFDAWPTKRLAAVKAATLLIWGREDALTPVGHGETLHKGIPNSRLEVLGHCGHLPQIEKPAYFNKLVLDFLFPSTQKTPPETRTSF
jgi:2-hydroxy-6-oxonona-2,4-dienedioate hydrolase